MVNVIVIAHAEIANSFADCIEHILSRRIANLHILAVRKTEDVETILSRAKNFINKISATEESLILTDIYGATPSNIALKLVQPGKTELITGLNLPMLIRAVCYAKDGLKVCVQKALDGGKSGIIYINGEEND